MENEAKRARRFAIISGKGGVGKTIITANVAAALTSSGQRVLVVDADLGLANLDVILGLIPKFTLHDVLCGKQNVEKVLLSTERGFDLLPAASGLSEDAVLTPSTTENIRSILSVLETRYDTILFDAGAGIGAVVLFFADLAHEILLVVTPEITSLMDAYATIKILKKNQGRSSFLLVVNQANPRHSGKISASVVNHLQDVASKFLEAEDCTPVRLRLIGSIPHDPIIPQAISQRRLLIDVNAQAPSTCSMNQIAESLLTGISNRVNRPHSLI